MDFLHFDEDELDILLRVINDLQLCFHPRYAPNGKFSTRDIIDLSHSDTNIMILADNNITTPICEIATTGSLKDSTRLCKIAAFVTWTKYIGAQISCGIGISENDTEHQSTIPGEKKRLQFLHGVNEIPSQYWKNLAFGVIDQIPKKYLYTDSDIENVEYVFSDNLSHMCNEAAMIKIVRLIRDTSLSKIDKFIAFMDWYTTHCALAESVITYAALVFSNTIHVALPKSAKLDDYDRVVRGIRNQAWDLTYITSYKMISHHYLKQNCICMIATDDLTQKSILVNLMQEGGCGETLNAVFDTKAERSKLKLLTDSKLGEARKNPFANKTKEENIRAITALIEREYSLLMHECQN